MLIFGIVDKVLITGGADGHINLSHSATGKSMAYFSAHSGSVGGISLSSGSRYLITGGSDSILKMWDLKQSRVLRQLSSHQSPITAVTHSSNDSSFASSDAAGEVIIHNSMSGDQIVSFVSADRAVRVPVKRRCCVRLTSLRFSFVCFLLFAE